MFHVEGAAGWKAAWLEGMWHVGEAERKPVWLRPRPPGEVWSTGHAALRNGSGQNICVEF